MLGDRLPSGLLHRVQPVTTDGPHRPRGIRALIHPLGPLFRHLPLSLRRQLLFLRHHGWWGNFRNPRSYAEKMQWRILNDHRPLLRWTADKQAQKEYARRCVAGRTDLPHLKIPATYWAGLDIAELRVLSMSGRLPADWVFKPNHSCGRVRLFAASDDGGPMPDWSELSSLARAWGDFDEEKRVMGHWAYGHARPAMLAEERIGGAHQPPEIKVLCFDGRAHSLMVQEGIGTANWRVAYYDTEFNRVHSGWSLEIPMDEHDIRPMLSAELRAEIIRAAELLAAPFDFMRVDFYLSDGFIWVGELTPYSGGGLVAVSRELDFERGSHWQLPDLAAHDPRGREWNELLEIPLKGTLQQ